MMFHSADTDTLKAALDHYPVPMFAAQRANADTPFHLLCLNDAHMRVSGMKSTQITGLRPLDILDADEGPAVEARYSSCADTNQVVSYREELHLNGRLTRWETTLLPVAADDGGQRVIGTAMTLCLPADVSELTDAEYYAAQAQMRMGQITQFFSLLERHDDLPHDLRTGAMMMAGLNRSLDHLLQDMRLALHGLPPQRVDTRGHAAQTLRHTDPLRLAHMDAAS